MCFYRQLLSFNVNIVHTVLVNGITTRCAKRDMTTTLYFCYLSIRYTSQKPQYLVILKKKPFAFTFFELRFRSELMISIYCKTRTKWSSYVMTIWNHIFLRAAHFLWMFCAMSNDTKENVSTDFSSRTKVIKRTKQGGSIASDISNDISNFLSPYTNQCET